MGKASDRLGAEVLRMRSMWDSIETHCWPVDKLAAVVVCSKARWQRTEHIPFPDRAGEKLTIEEVIDVTRPPPKHLVDKRGLRTRNFVTVGYCDTREVIVPKSSCTIKNSMEQGYGYLGTKPFQRPQYVKKLHSWFVLRSDGEIFIQQTSKPRTLGMQLKRSQKAWDAMTHRIYAENH